RRFRESVGAKRQPVSHCHLVLMTALAQAFSMASNRLPTTMDMQSSSRALKRCAWAKDQLYVAYHDQEWGVPVHDDRLLFEFLILEGAQAGLSWITILKKRENYRRAFDNFDARKVAHYDSRKIRKLLADPGIVRNRLKIQSAVLNAQAF